LRPFRFGVAPHGSRWRFPFDEWPKMVKKLETLGYSTVFQCDHFQKLRHDPIAMLASAAAATERLNIGTFVFDVDYRHPVILAKAAATLHLLSNGRFEFGIGAGWDKKDYDMAGIPYDPPYVRVSRLEEAVQIIMGMWTQEKTSFSGKHYQVNDIWKAGNLPEGEHPKMFIGGGGKRVLTIAGKYADIVGININLKDYGKKPPEEVWTNVLKNQTFEAVKEKVGWARKAAESVGRDSDELEFQLFMIFSAISNKPKSVLEDIYDRHKFALDEDDIHTSAHLLIGTGSENVEKLKRIREETSINYYVFNLRREQLDEYAEKIVKPLTN